MPESAKCPNVCDLFCSVLALILLGSLLFAACGGGEEGTRQLGSTTTATATAAPETAPARRPERTPPEERVTPTPKGAPPLAMTSPETDREAMVALYNSTNGPNWRYSANWLSDAPVSEWYGVTTDNNGRVIELRLNENQLSGEIPPELGNLANLTRLDLGGNELSGCVPTSRLGQLSSDSDLGGLPTC